MKQGLAEYVPISIAHLPRMIELGRIPVDVALIQVSPPDEFGYVSLGVSVDMMQSVVARAKYIVAEVNPQMPRTMGDSTLHIDKIDQLVPVDMPVIEYVHTAAHEETVERIARYKRPKEYRFVDSLPTNNYGKVVKRELRERLVAEV
mgnify:CR=1 FL=1